MYTCLLSVVTWGMERERIRILHHSGAAGVTGSCHQLFWADGHSILMDCGLFQGDEEQESPEITFPISSVKALVLTHVHIDHCGRIPYLMAAGFTGPVYCSEPSALLLPEMLADAFSLGISRSRRLREIHIVHGERDARKTLAEQLNSDLLSLCS